MADVIRPYIPPRQEWEKDLVFGRFMNLERKGEDHSFTVNGKPFHLKHGAVVKVPRAVVEALKDAVKIEWRLKDIESHKVPEKYEDPRMYFEILSEDRAKALMPEANKDLIAEITEVQQGERGRLDKENSYAT